MRDERSEERPLDHNDHRRYRGAGRGTEGTYVLRSLAALLAGAAALPVGGLGAERGHVVVALLGVPLLAALLPAEAEAVVFGLPLGVGSGGRGHKTER